MLREGCQKLQGNTISLISDEKKDQYTQSQLAILGTFFATERYQMHSILIDMNGKLIAEIKIHFTENCYVHFKLSFKLSRKYLRKFQMTSEI